MNRVLTITILILASSCSLWAQLKIENSSGHVVMQVDENANVIIGPAAETGHLTTEEMVITDKLTFSSGAVGHVLRSTGSGVAAWGLENQRLSLEGNTLSLTDGAGTALDQVDLPTGSDNQNLILDGYQLSIERGTNVTLPNDRPLAGTQITVSGDGKTVNHANTSNQGSVNNSSRTVIQDISLDGNGHVTTINSATLADNVNDADHNPNGERQHLSYNASTGEIRIDNGGHSAGNAQTIPGTLVWDYDTPRTVLIDFDGSSIDDVYYRDGDLENAIDPGASESGWTSASTTDYSEVTDGDAVGIEILNGLLNCPITSDISAIYVSVYYYDALNSAEKKIAYVGPNKSKFLKVLNAEGDTIAESENGVCPLSSSENFYLMSQYQGGVTDERTTEIWVTIWGYILK